MIRILAIDTSTGWGSLALVEQAASDADPLLVAELGLRVADSHAVRLVQRIDLLIDEAGWSCSAMDGFVVIRGPGSFTGIRIGLGTARGLALSTDRPCCGISSLEALAEAHGPAEWDRVPLIGAGRGEIYAARYDAQSSPPVELRGPWLGEASEAVPTAAGPAVVIACAPREALALGLTLHSKAVRLAHAGPHLAGAAGRLALLRGLALSAESSSLAPLYVRPPDAELKSRRR